MVNDKEKLNLNKPAVEFHWKCTDQRLAKVLQMMERVEHWTVDDVESVVRELINLGKKISTSDRDSLTSSSESILLVMAYINCGKAMRIMNWLDENHPGLSFHYTLEARQMDDTDAGRLMIDRLRAIKTVQLLSEIFTPSRTRLITEILKEKNEE